MKKLFVLISCSIVFITCKKEKQAGLKEIACGKEKENGALVIRYSYSKDKKMTKEEYYDTKTGKLQSYTTFEYDAAGRHSQDKGYDPNKLIEIVSYQFNTAGQMILHEYKSLSGPDSGQILSRVKYRYDTNGRLDRLTYISPVTGDTSITVDYSYYPNGYLLKKEVNYYSNNQINNGYKADYSPATQVLPSDPLKFAGYPLNENISAQVSSEIHYTNYNGAHVKTGESAWIYDRREYDSKGYLIKQRGTHKFILPQKVSEEKILEYEYVEL